jgi:hypothetical protein
MQKKKETKRALFRTIAILTTLLLAVLICQQCSLQNESRILLSCSEKNDLYLVLKNNRIPCRRYDTPEEAVRRSVKGSGILILADDYPVNTTSLDSLIFEEANRKDLRLYIEYPSWLPGMKSGQPKETALERVVVVTDRIPGLDPLQILSIHGCHYTPFDADDHLLSVSKVAGFDRAVYGTGEDVQAILFNHPSGNLLVSTTRLSQFVTARYAPKESMQALWGYILSWVTGGHEQLKTLSWESAVRASYGPDDELPANAERTAIQRGIDWHTNAKMILSKGGWDEYRELWKLDDYDINTTVPAVNNAAPLPVSGPGDGTYGVLEGIASEVKHDGSQPARWWLRSDSNGESSLAFALRSAMDGDQKSRLIAGNLLDWLYFSSGLFQNDPAKDNYGLLFWAPGNAQALYQDNDIKAILGCIGTAGILETDKWDEVLVKNILGNFRTTGINGFRGRRIENPDLMKKGWQSYMKRDFTLYQPHYEAWTWSSYLWLYDKTGWKPLLEKTRKGISMMMNAYPDGWRWTNGIQQERGRMLLPLAWLIRVDDRPEYRRWIRILADEIEKCQDKSGAIREELGDPSKGDYVPPLSNEAYGTNEAPLIQENGDKVADLLYTCNFTFLGLHEAYAATGDIQFKRMADRLADFLVRVQVKSDKHASLDGGWMRAFDYGRWDYLGSNADSGWGAWSIEVGWTQGWVTSVLAMRELETNLWQISKKSKVSENFNSIRREMLPDMVLSNNY